MKFSVFQGPYIKSDKKTNVIMKHLIIVLLPIIMFSVYKNGYLPYKEGYGDLFSIFYPLIFVLIAMLTTFLTEFIYYKFIKKDLTILKNSYPIITGILAALVLPLNTPIPILIFGCLIAIIIGKLIFGGFGNNIFNPALIGVLFVTAIYGNIIVDQGGYLNKYEADAISSATPLSVVTEEIGTYQELVKPYGQISDFFLGTIPGSVGETSALLIIMAFLYLAFYQMIKWRITIAYVATVFLMTYFIGFLNDLSAWYAFFHIFSGGLLFGAVFMATDPVTSPVTPIGQILFGLFLGILTVIFRFLTPYPEGVLTAILTMNLFVFILDKIGQNARLNFKKASLSFVFAWLLIIVVSLGIANSFAKETQDQNFAIIEIIETESTVIYHATQRGFSGIIEAEVVIEQNEIVDMIIISQNESYWQRVADANYIEKLLLADDFNEVDAISSATITCNSLKTLLNNVLEDYHGKKD